MNMSHTVPVFSQVQCFLVKYLSVWLMVCRDFSAVRRSCCQCASLTVTMQECLHPDVKCFIRSIALVRDILVLFLGIKNSVWESSNVLQEMRYFPNHNDLSTCLPPCFIVALGNQLHLPYSFIPQLKTNKHYTDLFQRSHYMKANFFTQTLANIFDFAVIFRLNVIIMQFEHELKSPSSKLSLF